MSDPTVKFLRSHFARNSMVGAKAIPYMMKLIYEFWGFCVNGDNDLRNPGSFAFASTTPIFMPTGFVTGSLLTSGSDGSTTLGFPFFSSSLAPFSASMVGKHIVTWVSGSTSTDDSIYEITQFINSGTLRLDTRAGGTPYNSRNGEPFFTTRSNINYRILDLVQTNNLTFVSGNYMVLQVPAAPEINVDQLIPQVRLDFVQTSQTALRMILSPSGTWNGSTFTDGGEFKAVTGNGSEWTNGNSGPGKITLIAARDFLFSHGMGRDDDGASKWFTGGGGIYFEIPERLYPKENDPNPLVGMLYGTGLTISELNNGFGGMMMVDRNGKIQSYESYSKSPMALVWSDRIASTVAPSEAIFGDHQQFNFNQFTTNMWWSDVILNRTSTTEYSLARVRCRRFRYVPSTTPNNQLFGDKIDNQWIKIAGSIMLPWDNARLPFSLLDLGS